MAINFPASPATNDTYTVGNKTWIYNGYAWDLVVGNTAPAFDKANSSYSLAQVAFDRANLSNDVLVITGAYDTANAAFNKANAANLLAYGTGIGANAYSDTVGTAANNHAGVMANAANAYAASLTPDLSSIYLYSNNVGTAGNSNLSVATISSNNFAGAMVNSANAYIVTVGIAGNTYTNAVGIAANTWANTKLSNTDGVTFAGSLHISNTLYAYDVVVANTMTANISGNVNSLYITNDITHVNSIFFNTTALTAANGQVVAGQLTWNPDDKTLDLGTGESIQQVGMEQYYRILNQSGETIYNSNAVAYYGTTGNSGKLLGRRAIANNSYDSKNILGIATEDIINGAEGFVTTFGKVRKIDTSMFSEGDILYVSSSIPGALQNTKPSAPNNKVQIGTVITKSATVGMIFAAVQRSSSLADDELASFNGGLVNGDVIVYVSANGRFENQVQLALNAGSVDGLTANTIIEAANGYSRVFANSVGTAANANLSVGTIAANTYAASVGVAANAYTDTVIIANVEIANAYSRVFANSVGSSVNANLSIATIAANSYAASVGESANNLSGVMANAANAYAASLTPDLSPVFIVANAAFDKANAANVLAYNALPKTGGTVSGDVVVTGNLTVSGETTYANTQTLLIGDNIFVLNADLPVTTAPSEDAGMEVNRGSSTNVALKWNESTDKWTFTNNGTTYLNIASNTDVESAGSITTSDTAPSSPVDGQLWYNTTIGKTLVYYDDGSTSQWVEATAGYIYVDTTFTGVVFNATNTKVSSVTGTAGQIYSSGGTTPTLNLITTGVTSSVYGGSTQIPVISVDTYGRITSASNVSVQGMDYAFANTKLANTSGTVFDGNLLVSNSIAINKTSAGYALDVVGTINASNVLVNGSPISANLSGYATNNSPSFTGTVTFNANVLSQTLTDAATIAWDTSLGQVATVTLTAAGRTMGAPTNLKVGTYILHVIQDAGGSKTITTWNSIFKWPAGVAPVLTTTANARDLFSFISDGTNLYGSFLPDVK